MKDDYENNVAIGDLYEERLYSGLTGFVMHNNHKLLERKFTTNNHFSKVLEIGGGGGIHIKYVKHEYDEYILSDISDVVCEAARRKFSTGNIKVKQLSGISLDIPDNYFDRLIASHVLEHIPNPQIALREWSRVVKPGGVMSIAIPCDPGIPWRLGRYFVTAPNAKKQGIHDFYYHIAKEHVNSVNNLIALIRYYFDDISEDWFPFKIPLMDFNLLCVIHINIK